MAEPIVLPITGLPGTGKTTLGRRIAKEFHLPFISRDAIKEILFETLGWSDRAWSKKLGGDSYAVLRHLAEVFLQSQSSYILESNFHQDFDTKPFLALQERYDFFPLQIVCQTNGPVLFERFKQRAESGERHPGHVDQTNYQEFEQLLLQRKYEPLDIGGACMTIDTTVFDQLDYDKIFRDIREKIGLRKVDDKNYRKGR